MSKIALITGAARGVGLASSKKFSAHGYEVLMLDRDETELENAVQEVAGTTELYFNISLKEATTEIAASLIRSHGALNAPINNAGVAEFETIENCSVESWRRVMETNLDGMFYLSQALIPTLRTSKGSIVNIASISGLRASTLRVAYGTSKAASTQLSKQQAVELNKYGIRVNYVAPGPVGTKLEMAVHTQDIIDAFHDAIPLNCYSQEDEITNATYFLASNQASYITGQVLAVDGGFEATGAGLPALRR